MSKYLKFETIIFFRYFWNYLLHIICWRLMSWQVIQIFHIQTLGKFRFLNKKLMTFKFSQHQQKSIIWRYCCLLLFFFRFFHMYIVCWRLIPWKKAFISVSLLLFTEKLGRSSYEITTTHYDVIFILPLFKFVANVQFSLF